MSLRFFPVWRLLLVGALLLPSSLVLRLGAGETTRLLILHTNDHHDHLRAGPGGVGGLPYVSGFIRSVRTQHPDVLLLDAGDVTEKGDLVGFRTQGVMTFEAMRRIGYDAVTPGNHDFDDLPLSQLRAFERALGQPLVCLNVRGPGDAPLFAGSRLFVKAGLHVGVIGLLTPRPTAVGGLDFATSGRALAAESARLRALGAHVVIALCHESESKCAQWSRAAPDVQVFVSGHSHRVLNEPMIVPETGAIIVQAGSYARWVGWLELEVDPASRRVVSHSGRLVRMTHGEVPVDAEMLAWVTEREQEVAPEADDFVVENLTEVDAFAVATLGAEALRVASGADVAFCHRHQIIRNVLPVGSINVNDVFKAGGQRGAVVVEVRLTGAQIAAYADALERIQREPPSWAGFRRWRTTEGASGITRTDLDPERTYRVVMAQLEWETRFLRLAARRAATEPGDALGSAARAVVRPIDLSFTDAVVAYLRAIGSAGETPAARIAALEQDRASPEARALPEPGRPRR